MMKCFDFRAANLALMSGVALSTYGITGNAVTLGYVAAGLQYPYNVAVAKGFQDAAKKEGVEVIVLDAKTSVERQSNAIDDLIAQNVNGIAVLPLDGVVAERWADRAAAHKIPFVSVATELGDPQKRAIKDVYPAATALVASDEIHTGEVAGEIAATLLPRDRVIKVAIVEGAPGYPQVWQRSKGFKQALDKAGIKYEVVASQPTDWTAEKGEAVCQNILTAHPDTDVFYNQADDMVIGCAKAVRAVGSHAKLIGWGGSRLGLSAIKAGEVDGTVCLEPEKMGRLAFAATYQAVLHPETPKGRFIQVDTPPVTRENLATCKAQW
jgi:ribose transport system substrate-binding protein